MTIRSLTVAATDATASENNLDNAVFTVTRTYGNTMVPLTVNYTIGGTAANEDYATLRGVVTIPVGVRTATIVVTPIDDVALEPTETVVVSLAAGSYTIGTAGSATADLLDNEPIVRIEAVDATASEDPGNPGMFLVTRTGNPTYDLVVSYTVLSTGVDAASPGQDYTALSGTVTILAGATSAQIEVLPVNDSAGEGSETVALSITGGGSPSYRVGSPASAVVTILDNEPTVTIEATDAQASESGQNPGEFTLTRTGGDVSADLTVYYSIWGGASGAGLLRVA